MEIETRLEKYRDEKEYFGDFDTYSDTKPSENFKISDYRGKYVLFFFYPLDFTFVCPTELHAFQEKLEDFKRMNCEIFKSKCKSFSYMILQNKKAV